MKLLKDIGIKDKIYGKQGDEVTVISVMGNVSIVELNGDRFSVKNEDLGTVKIEPAKEETKKLITREPPKKQIKAVPINQNSLFQ